MASFTNIAYQPSTFYNSYSGSGSSRYAVDLINDSTYQLYQGNTVRVQATRSGYEGYVRFTNSFNTNLVTNNVYYLCFWAKTNTSTRTVEAFIGSTPTLIVESTTVNTSTWTRCSGIATCAGGGNKYLRLDNNAGISYCYYCGFLCVNLTSLGLASKSKAWCDDHFYYVNPGASGSYTDYDAEGTRANSYVSGTPTVTNLYTYQNAAANKSSRTGVTVSSPGSYASASWINAVRSAQTATLTRGATVGSCGVVKATPANYATVTAPTTGSTGFYSSGRTMVNQLIRNADALYAQTYCVQNSLTYATCEETDCCNTDCCDNYEINHYCSSYYDCRCDSDDCGVDECGECDYCDYTCKRMTYTDCDCEGDYWCCYSEYSCTESSGCSCNSVCSCNWV